MKTLEWWLIRSFLMTGQRPSTLIPKSLTENIMSFYSFIDYERLIHPRKTYGERWKWPRIGLKRSGQKDLLIWRKLEKKISNFQIPFPLFYSHLVLLFPPFPPPHCACQLQTNDQMVVKLLAGNVPESPEKCTFLSSFPFFFFFLWFASFSGLNYFVHDNSTSFFLLFTTLFLFYCTSLNWKIWDFDLWEKLFLLVDDRLVFFYIFLLFAFAFAALYVIVWCCCCCWFCCSVSPVLAFLFMIWHCLDSFSLLFSLVIFFS